MARELGGLTFIVPFPAGGSTDFTARILGERLAELSGVEVGIETTTGDMGSNAVRALQAADADRVFLVGNINANSVAPVMRRGTDGIDHWRVVRPITKLAEFPSVVCTNEHFPADTLAEFIAKLKRSTGVIRYGTDFLGTYVDVDVIRLSERAGLERACMTADGALRILDNLEAGRVDLAILNVATSAANKARLKPLAVTGPARLRNFPEVPRLDEVGYSGIGTSNWQGLFASRGVSQDRVAALHGAVLAAMDDAETRWRFDDVDASVSLSPTPGQFEAEIEAESAQWEKYAAAIAATPLLPG